MQVEVVDTLTRFAVMVAIVVASIVALVLVAAGTSLGRSLLPRVVTDVVSKLLPRARVRDAASTGVDEFAVEVTASEGPRTVHVRRSGEITLAWTFDTNAVFPKSGTFALTTFRHNLQPDSATSPVDVESRVRASLEAALQPKNFRPAGAEAADLKINVFGALEDEVTLDTIDAALEWPDGHDWPATLSAALQHGDAGETATFARGSLVLDVVDARTAKVLWHAAAIADIVVDADSAEQERRTLQAISGMLNHFPPGE
jgi:hypothetical protein